MSVSSFPSTSPEPSEDTKLYGYIGLGVAAVVLIVAAVIAIFLIVCLKKRRKRDKTEIFVNVADDGEDIDRMGLSAYGTTTFKAKEDRYEYASTIVNN